MMTRNIARATVIAILAKKLLMTEEIWPGKAMLKGTSKKEVFNLMIESVPDAIADILMAGRGEDVDKKIEIANTISLYTNPETAKDVMLSIIDALHNRFGYDI